MAVTYTQSNKILNNLFGASPFTPTPTLWVGLSTTPIDRNGTGVTEPSGAGYTRVAVTNNKSYFTVSSSGTLSNSRDITFPESSSSWGTIIYVFIADASSGGNILYYDSLTTPRNVEALTTLMFATNTLQITLS